MNNKNFIQASQYCEKVFDGTHDTPKPTTNGFPLVTSKHIVGGKLDLTTAYNISKEDFENVNRRSRVKQWDVLFSMIGSIGEVYLETKKDIPYAIKNVGVFSSGNEEKAKWLYYYLKSPYAKKHISNYLSGAVQKFLSLGALREFPILPFDSEKSLITSILCLIDQKIELNNKVNAELEAMVKTIYDYWFVQFDFPDANGKPYKSSGGKMVWNEELKREIPGAWKVMYLEKLLKTSVDKSVHIESKDIAEEGRYPVITQDVGDFIKGYTDENDPIMDIPLIIFGDHSCTLRYVDFPFFRGADGTQVMRFEDNLVIYAYLFLKSIISQIPNFGKYERHFKYIKEINILVPDKETLDKFQSITQPHFNKIKDCRLESEELANLRDWLLPMLMNGQVKVKNNED
jgi:type I restriction enzyme, S subunit